MPEIKLKKITFGDPPFRKLGNLSIEFAERMTVIAGHNGIGKSTIMALVAHTSGLSTSQQFKTLFGKAFQGNLFEIAFIDYEKEYRAPKDKGTPLPEPFIEYCINNTDTLVKACSLTGRSNSKKARVVSRTVPHQEFVSSDKSIAIGPDAKVPLPTIYLGMTRMFPVGEANPKWVKSSIDKTLNPAERSFISKFINEVVSGLGASPDGITTTSIKGTGKTAKHPKYSHDPRCVSLGQDSLGSIATALASFQQLKREWPEYPGGIFVIDEVDAGLHPQAQRKLIRALMKAARDLRLQIIATTHSTHVLEEVHPDGRGHAKAPDCVSYLIDTALPRLGADFTLEQILNDMNLKPPGAKLNPLTPEVKVYFEDDEAAFFFSKFISRQFKSNIKRKFGVKLVPMPMGCGGTNLVGFSKHDPYFKQVVIAVDADTLVSRKTGYIDNVVKLPGSIDPTTRKGLSPDRSLYKFIEALVEEPKKHSSTWTALTKHEPGLSTDQLRSHLLEAGLKFEDRDSMKKWWGRAKEHIENWQIVEAWAQAHASEVATFLADLETKIMLVSSRLSTPVVAPIK